MATCANCHSEISFLDYSLSGLTNSWANWRRTKWNLVVTCKHCGRKNAQETMSVLGGVLVLIAAGAIIFILWNETGHNDNNWVFFAVPSLGVLHYVWWKFFTRLREL